MIFDRGVNYIKEHGRPLERKLLEYYFFDGSKYDVLEELIKYHNSDGGFGKSLEPDFRAKESSVLCTCYALDIMIDLDFDATEACVTSAIKYLIDNYDRNSSTWRYIPELNEYYAHAPWWNQDKLSETFNNFVENPKAKICSYLLHFKEVVSESFSSKIMSEVLDYLEHRDNNISPDSILCYLKLLKCKNLSIDADYKIKKRLKALIPANIESNPEKWGEYNLKPVDVISSNDSPFIDSIIDIFNTNLDYVVETQNSDGSWPVCWTWGDVFPENWHTAEREWMGIVTLERLKLLKEFQRI